MPRLTQENIHLRGSRVGASEVAALLPCGHPFVTPADIYARIVHGINRSSTALMSLGSDLEPAILRIGAVRMGVRARANARTYTHPDLPLGATPDALVLGAPELIEVKLVSHWGADLWGMGPPPHVLAQVQAQMLVTGRRRCHVVAMLGGERIETHSIEADGGAQADIEVAVRSFGRAHLYPKVPPPDTPPELLFTIMVPEGTVAADADAVVAGDALAWAMGLVDEAEAPLRGLRSEVLGHMVRLGASTLTAPRWTATAKPDQSGGGRASLTFRRRRHG
jgi:hypothetical protein